MKLATSYLECTCYNSRTCKGTKFNTWKMSLFGMSISLGWLFYRKTEDTGSCSCYIPQLPERI